MRGGKARMNIYFCKCSDGIFMISCTGGGCRRLPLRMKASPRFWVTSSGVRRARSNMRRENDTTTSGVRSSHGNTSATAPCRSLPRSLLQQRTGAHSAWVSLPPSHSSFGGSGPTYTSPCGAAPRPLAIDGSSSSTTSVAVQSLSSRKSRSAAALFYTPRNERHRPAVPIAAMVAGPPPMSSPLFASLGGTVHYARGRGARGFRLGAVTAVRSPGDGGGVATAVGEGGELRGAFDASVGEEGLLGLDGFRVRIVVFCCSPSSCCCCDCCFGV